MSEPNGILDISCPINWSHPLNRGLIGCWAVVPSVGWRGGLSWRDLVRGGHKPNDGTLTNIAFPPTTTSGWNGPKGRPGGYGSISLDGSDDYVVTGILWTPTLVTNPITLSCWAMTTGTGRTQWAISLRSTVSGGLNIGQRGGAWKVEGFGPNSAPNLASSTTPAVGVWYHVAYTWDGSATGVLFINGAPVATNSTVPQADTLSAIYLGSLDASFDRWLGFVDDGRVYNRALTATQVAALYAESRRGYPEAWRWIKPPIFFSTQLTTIVLADLSKTLDTVTISSISLIIVSTSTAQTLGTVTSASTSVVIVSASSSSTLGTVTLGSTSVVIVGVSSSSTLSTVTVSSSGLITVTTSSGITLDNAVLSSSNSVAIIATGGIQTLTDVGVSSTNSVVVSPYATITLDSVTIPSSSVGVVVSASSSKTLDDVTLIASNVSIYIATLSVFLDNVTLSTSSSVRVTSSLTNTLTNVSIASNVDTGAASPTPSEIWTEDQRGITWTEQTTSRKRGLIWGLTRIMPQTLIQRPGESALYGYDFSHDAIIAATPPDPILTITSVLASLTNPDTETGLPTLGTPSISDDGTEVLVEITAPLGNNIEYLIRFVVVTTAGYTRVGLGVLAVNED